jgi:hypothetical protein
MIIKVQEVCGVEETCTGEDNGKLLYEALRYALEQKRTEKVVADFAGIKDMDAEFLSSGIISLMGVYAPNDLASNLDFANIENFYMHLLQKIGKAYIEKLRNGAEFVACVREVGY